MSITIAGGKKMRMDTLFVECVGKSWDVKPFVRSAFVQDVEKRKKNIQVLRTTLTPGT